MALARRIEKDFVVIVESDQVGFKALFLVGHFWAVKANIKTLQYGATEKIFPGSVVDVIKIRLVGVIEIVTSDFEEALLLG